MGVEMLRQSGWMTGRQGRDAAEPQAVGWRDDSELGSWARYMRAGKQRQAAGRQGISIVRRQGGKVTGR